MPDCALVRASEHVWRFTPDNRSDRPALGVVAGRDASLLVDVGASVSHLSAFLRAIEPLGLPPLRLAVLTHWHWDHVFGGAVLDCPIAAHRLTAAELAREAAYDWSDAALEQRVQAGSELAFCAEMLRLELPDRSDLRIVEPQIVFGDEGIDVRLGGVTCTVRRIGGDHAADSCAIHVEEDGLLFLGDALAQRLHAPVEHRTIAGTRALVARLTPYDAEAAILGHWPDVLDRTTLVREYELLSTGADRVERLGAAAIETAADDDDREVLAELIAGLES